MQEKKIWRQIMQECKTFGFCLTGLGSGRIVIFVNWQHEVYQTRENIFFFCSGVTVMECCSIVGLPPCWVDTDVSQLYISNSPHQPGGLQAPSRSPPVPWWSKWHTDSSVNILPGIWTCHTAKEVELWKHASPIIAKYSFLGDMAEPAVWFSEKKAN